MFFIALQSLDDLCDEDDEVAGLDERGYEEDSEGEHDQEYLSDKPDRKEAEKREVGKETLCRAWQQKNQCPELQPW